MKIRGEQEGLQRRVFSVHDEQEMMMERKCMLQYLYARTHVHRTTKLPQGETFVAGVDVDCGRKTSFGVKTHQILWIDVTMHGTMGKRL